MNTICGELHVLCRHKSHINKQCNVNIVHVHSCTTKQVTGCTLMSVLKVTTESDTARYVTGLSLHVHSP